MKSLITGCIALFILFAVAFIMTGNTEKRLVVRINRQTKTIERLHAALARCEKERQRVRLTIRYHVVETTGYTTGPESCGRWADGRTCHNKPARPGVTLATDENYLPHGCWYHIQGLGFRRAEDRGSAIKGWKADILFRTLKQARHWGRKKVLVTW